ncbi:uncharacterized protein VNE69_01162 [Vairimorpha necatrix]|uniref:Membrane protein n=1 Tax=Vairimorpha necatrix TaxID=6039 RepID=A0AAX4J8D9_9MICR
MRIFQEVKNALFVFINFVSLANYGILGERLISLDDDFSATKLFTTKNISILYTSLIIFIGIRIFAFFVGRDLNDLYLHRSLNPGGTRTKLRVLGILIICEIILFGMYIFSILYPYSWSSYSNFKFILVLIVFSYILNFLNLVLIYIIHPDLLGLRYKESVKQYCQRRRRDRDVMLEI